MHIEQVQGKKFHKICKRKHTGHLHNNIHTNVVSASFIVFSFKFILSVKIYPDVKEDPFD